MSRLKIVGVSLLVILALILGSLLLAPSALITPIINSNLATSGLRVTELVGVQLGLNQTSLDKVQLESNGLQAELSGLELNYRASELLAGRLHGISADQLNVEVSITAATNSSEGADQTLEEILLLLENLPFDNASIDSINLEAGEQQVSASVSMSTQPTRISGQLQSPSLPDWRIDLSVSSESPAYLVGNIELYHLLENTAEATFSVNVSGDDLSLDSESGIDLQRLQELPQVARLLGPWRVSTGGLYLTNQLLMEDVLQEPTLSEFAVSIDSNNSLLEFNRNDQASPGSAHLDLPLNIDVAQSSGEQLQLSLGRLQGELSLATGDSQLRMSPSLSNVELQCDLWSRCSLATALKAQLEASIGEQLEINAAQVNGNISGSVEAGTLRLLAPQLSASLNDVVTPVSNSSVDVRLDGMTLLIGDDIESSVYFLTTSMDPGIEGLDFNAPMLSGDAEFRDGKLTLAMLANISNRFTTAILLEHDLAATSGTAAVDLRQYVFSELTPLSSLVTQDFLDADIVAGTASGDAQIQWQKDAAGAWGFAGPLRLLLEDLSGYYQENIFVDMDTELQAQLVSLEELRSEGSLEASIGTIDVGLPIESVNWRYEFNTAQQQLSILDLNSTLLGGSVAVPTLQYNSLSPQNQLNLVLEELDLATIVGLANYPNVFVDGLISGYLPITFDGTGISIDEGLVGALNPGGSIRYTPASPTPSQNASVQLLNDALSNYQYETMNTQVYYDESGDLRMEVQLRGINPDMNNGQPINLNVSITDNIPSLLQSLRAGRAITERLEEQLELQ